VAFVSAVAVAVTAAASQPPASRGATVRGRVSGKRLLGQDAVVVSLEAPGLAVHPPSAPVLMDQKGFQFVPHVLPVARGTTVRFLNGDPEPHNVYSPEGRYDLGTWRRGETRDYTFEAPGVYTQRCRVHPEMIAYVVVLETPYFALRDSQGLFEIHDIVPGKYKLVVWSHKLDGLEQEVTLEEGKALSLDLVVDH
jgi:plastocyanin